MRTTILSLLILGMSQHADAITLHVGIGQPYATIEQAAPEAVPGDTLLVHAGDYQGGMYIADLQGTAEDLIYILVAPGEVVFYTGGSNAWQFTDAAYLHIEGFIFQGQTGNGVNFDDGGTYDTPAHHIVFANCTFRNINASGNNDLLKLSGMDNFEIRNCVFLNGSAGGSGIDMVGCHEGSIHDNHFENQGSNSIQAKGGTSHIRIERNFFKNGGSRVLNLGGSTGLQFFRPLDAPYEAAELKVYSNVFIGSDAPIAFVGSIHCEVVNNTLYLPTKWVLRILQETVDTSRFAPCGYNTFRNNLIYIDNRVNVECNIGPNTAPETFTFSNNFWFHSEDSGWPGPDLPVADDNNVVGEDPLFEDASSENFALMQGSTAIGAGLSVAEPILDYTETAFLNPPSAGAFEGGMTTAANEPSNRTGSNRFSVSPNPVSDAIQITLENPADQITMTLTSVSGQQMAKRINVATDANGIVIWTLPKKYSGLFILTVEAAGYKESQFIFCE
jgi:hypothetical protein